MPQQRISAFFAPSVDPSCREAQLQQAVADHTAAVQEAEQQRGDRRALARLQQIRAPPPQRKRRGSTAPVPIHVHLPITINGNTNVLSVSVAATASSSSSSSPPPSSSSSPSSLPSSASPSPSSSSSSSSSSPSSSSPSSSPPSASSSSPLDDADEKEAKEALPKKRAWTDWSLNPSLFTIAHNKVQSMQSYARAVDALQHEEAMAGAFAMLRESTVRSWYVRKTFQLKDSWVRRWQKGASHLPRSGRPSVLSAHPMLEAYVIDAVISIRAGGGTVNSLIVRAFFRAYCRVREPALLKKLRLSRRWCRWWLNQKFPQWDLQKGDDQRTKAAEGLQRAGGGDGEASSCRSRQIQHHPALLHHQLGPDRSPPPTSQRLHHGRLQAEAGAYDRQGGEATDHRCRRQHIGRRPPSPCSSSSPVKTRTRPSRRPSPSSAKS